MCNIIYNTQSFTMTKLIKRRNKTMRYCQNCGKKIERGSRFCFSCGKTNVPIKQNPYGFLVCAFISLIFTIVCFIPQMYISKNIYRLGGARVAADYGDYSELNRLHTLMDIADIGVTLGVVFGVICVLLIVFYFISARK